MGMKHAFSPLPAVRRLFLNVAYSQFRFKVQPENKTFVCPCMGVFLCRKAQCGAVMPHTFTVFFINFPE